jgi:hypothetical protein
MLAPEVTTPFRIKIPGGTSTFTIHVPRHHITKERRFYFKELKVEPDFFSQEADKLNLDADPEMDKFVDYPVKIKLDIKKPAELYGPMYKNSKATSTTAAMMEEVNEHFENNKPNFSNTTPFFLDWTDILVADNMDAKEYVTLLSETYYGEYFKSVLHADRLPVSVRNLDEANNFVPPFDAMIEAAFNQRIRLRIWMAPYTKAIFSSNEPFVSELGFTEDQFGKKTSKHQYELVNRSENFIVVATGQTAPKYRLTKWDFKITLSSYDEVYTSPIQISRMKQRDWLNDKKVATYLSELFNLLSRQSNVIFTFGYREEERKFYFNLPDSANLAVTVSCLPDFAIRLGFGPVHFITKGMQALPQKEPDDGIVQAQKKALALVYDTGPIVCTLDQVASNTTCGTEDQIMAIVYPTVSGILDMEQSMCSCKGNAVHIHALTQSNAARVPISFRLLRIYDDEKMANFLWKNDAYAYGSFQGF